MGFRLRAALLAICAAATAAACNGRAGLLGPDYEYEEDLTLRLDGSATLVVNASAASLAALHGLAIDADLQSRVDAVKAKVAEAYTSPYAEVVRVTAWTRHGRRFVGVRLRVPDVRLLSRAAPFAWAAYGLQADGEQVVFRETIAGPARRPADLRGLTGSEIIAFRLHLPARIRWHNSRDLGGRVRDVARGNILTWEQTLRDRLDAKPVAWSDDHRPGVMEVRMDRQSILYRALWLFAIAFAAAVLALVALIWFIMRRGRADPR